MNLYTIRDKKAEHVSAPFAAPNDGVASRYVMESLRDQESMLVKYPGDYQVLYLGHYAEDDGSLHPTDHVRVLIEVAVLLETLRGRDTAQLTMSMAHQQH